MHRVLEGIVKSRRVASAYLFVGPPFSSKTEEALAFSEALGCNQKIDLLQLRPAVLADGRPGNSFKIEQVRDIQRAVRYGPSAGERLFVIVHGADTLTPEGSGAFLKTLEEPPPNVVFILLVEREDRILPTIASRCQKIIFGEAAFQWLRRPEFDNFYADLKGIGRKNVVELFEFSARLEKEKERLEELLYDLTFFARQELNDLKLARALLAGIKNLKKKANVKLALDCLCLKMSEA